MQVTRTDIDQLNATLTITIEPADYQEKVESQLKDIRRRANIPGFRKGMVPIGLVKKMYGKAVLGEEVNKAINEGIFNYVKEQKINMLGEPLPNEEATPAIDWEVDDTFTFAFDIAIAPEFDAKLNGKNKLTYYEVKVEDSDIDSQISMYANRFGDYIQADDVQDGDFLRGTLSEQKEGGIIKEDGMLMPSYMLDDEQKKLFEGAKKGDIITFNPKKAYDGNTTEIASLLGLKKEEAEAIDSDFTFNIETITRHKEAAIDENLFTKVFGEGQIKDEADFREKIKEEIKANNKRDSDYKFGLDARAAILKKMDGLQFPDAFLKRWLLKTDDKLTADKLEQDYPQMIEGLKWQLAKDQLTEHLGIKIEKDDVEAYAREIARMQFMQYGLMHVEEQFLTSYAQEMLKKEDQLRGLVERVAENKIYEAIKGAAKIEQKTVSHEEFNKLFS